MPQNILPDTHTGITATGVRKLRRIAATRPRVSVPFSLPSTLSVSTSPPWTPVGDVDLYSARALLGTAGTSSTVVAVYLNGSSLGTITLASGATSGSLNLDEALVADTDLITVGVTTVGTGAKDLTVLVRVA